ncbi:peptidase C26 [Solitalea longa]|uniref:Peptidase C26 n=1 Tax=Solitalea longa TaxID=2079460 RepID=A0A2S4ZYL4_9SPHI|nr:gamma-glutamyl-gamma-aminobutyrate hydrolase family protein [Solitalea longa]POY35087.1 peptidase C26 [Solitalea longa]
MLTIGVTDCSKYSNYSNWIISGSDDIEIIKLSPAKANVEDLKKCHGLLLTGGEDVNPQFYNKPEYLKYCYADDVNETRDEFELQLLELAIMDNLPILGICRGMQIANVFFGGTLIPDIPSWDKPSHSKLLDGNDQYHQVQVDDSSWLSKVLTQKQGLINSNHHQSVDKVGELLKISACSPDGVVEAIEWKEPDKKSFLCMVQWHPERMNDQESPFVRNIKNTFLTASKEKSV